MLEVERVEVNLYDPKERIYISTYEKPKNTKSFLSIFEIILCVSQRESLIYSWFLCSWINLFNCREWAQNGLFAHPKASASPFHIHSGVIDFAGCAVCCSLLLSHRRTATCRHRTKMEEEWVTQCTHLVPNRLPALIGRTKIDSYPVFGPMITVSQ